MGQKDLIIRESMKLFSLKGFMSTGINDIIEVTESSKGGFYYYFSSKEELFYEVLEEAQRIWREKSLDGIEQIDNPIDKIIQILNNYKDKYLKDDDDFPGGCLFITLSVELDDQLPHLAKEVEKGFNGLKRMLKRLLDEGKALGELNVDLDTAAVSEMLFTGMLGASVNCRLNNCATLDMYINSLVSYVNRLRSAYVMKE
jgi:TetR/AcrR family transcriptional repressor of nem operon